MRDIAQKLRRLLYVVPYVAKHEDGVHLDDLAEQMGVDRKSMMEDLDLLTQVGPPMGDPGQYLLISVEEDRVYVELPQRLTRPLRLTPAEGCSLLLGIRSLQRQGIAPLEESLSSAEKKLIDALGEDAPVATELAETTVVKSDEASIVETVKTMATASREHKSVSIRYISASRDAISERVVDPYGVVHHAGSWYLVGHCHKRADTRTFRVDRIIEFDLLSRSFSPPAGFDLEQYRREHLYVPSADAVAVRVHLTPKAAARVGSAWPAGDLSRHADGSADITIDCEGFEWVTSWVLSFGRLAKIVSPPAAKEALLAKLDTLAAQAA